MIFSHKQRMDIAKAALPDIRKGTDWSIRRWARYLGVTVPDIHQMANCSNGMDCTGSGCRIR